MKKLKDYALFDSLTSGGLYTRRTSAILESRNLVRKLDVQNIRLQQNFKTFFQYSRCKSSYEKAKR